MIYIGNITTVKHLTVRERSPDLDIYIDYLLEYSIIIACISGFHQPPRPPFSFSSLYITSVPVHPISLKHMQTIRSVHPPIPKPTQSPPQSPYRLRPHYCSTVSSTHRPPRMPSQSCSVNADTFGIFTLEQKISSPARLGNS